MKVSYNWLKKYINLKNISPEKLAELLNLHSVEIENLEKKNGDTILELAVLANRGDLLSYQGIVREIATLANLKLKSFTSTQKGKSKNPKLKIKNFKTNLNIKIEKPNLCPRYIALVIDNLEVKPSPRWMQDFLEKSGIRSINNIVDATNFVMLETGQPLHAFDADQLATNNHQTKIIIRKAKKGEKIITLDGIERKLDEEMLIIADSQRPIAIAGVIGGKETEVNENTKKVIIECAYFDPISIRRTSRKLGLRTEAVERFEKKGIDWEMMEKSLSRLAELIQLPIKEKIIVQTQKKWPRKKIKLSLAHLSRILGIEISYKKAKKILENLGFVVEFPSRDSQFAIHDLQITTPSWRKDIEIPEDLIEEISRVYGYNRIIPAPLKAYLIPPKENKELLYQEKIKNILNGFGFTEVYNYSFSSELQLTNKINDLDQTDKNIEIINPISEEERYMRTSLIPGLLRNVELNQKNFARGKIFEIGRVFKWKKAQREEIIEEKKQISGLIFDKKKSEKELFFEIKGCLEELIKKITNLSFDENQLPVVNYQLVPNNQPTRKITIKINQETIGMIGLIDLQTLESFGIKKKVVFFDLDFEKMLNFFQEKKKYRDFSLYPCLERDLAVVVNKEVFYSEIEKIILQTNPLIRELELFDLFEDEKILGKNKKSLAFHLKIQSFKKTLSREEADKIIKDVLNNLKEKLRAELR